MEYKELYLNRKSIYSVGIAKYTHVKDNIYMDTTCSDHENCLISVKEEDGKIVFDKAENISAEKYIYYHRGHGEFYTSKENAKLALFKKEKETYESYITRTKKEIDEAKVDVLSRKLKVNLIENIEDINFDDNLFAISNNNIIQLTVTLKEITKCGTVAIRGSVENKDDSEFILEKCDLKNVVIRDADDYGNDSEDDRTLYVFSTRKSAENYIKNEKSAAAAEKISNLEKQLNNYEEKLKEINDNIKYETERK